MLLKMGDDCSKHVKLILEINKCVIVATSWFFYTNLPTLMVHGQTQIKFKSNRMNNLTTSEICFRSLDSVSATKFIVLLLFYYLLLYFTPYSCSDSVLSVCIIL